MKSLMANNHKQELIAAAQGKRMFEYGSGGTTIELLKAGINLTSVEHSRIWYDQLIKHGKSQRLNMSRQYWEPYTAERNKSSEEDPMGLRNYIHQLGIIKNYDVILIDGLARGACLARVIYLCQKYNHKPLVYIHDTHRHWYDWVLDDFQLKFIKHDGSYPADMTRIIL